MSLSPEHRASSLHSRGPRIPSGLVVLRLRLLVPLFVIPFVRALISHQRRRTWEDRIDECGGAREERSLHRVITGEAHVTELGVPLEDRLGGVESGAKVRVPDHHLPAEARAGQL